MSKTKISYKWKGDEVTAHVKRAIDLALWVGVNIIEASAKPMTGFDTGNLRGSIFTKVDSDKQYGYVFTDVEYAVSQEFGTGIYAEDGTGRKDPWVFKARNGKFYKTKGNRPQPFMRPAFDKNHRRVQKEMARIIAEAIKKGGGV